MSDNNSLQVDKLSWQNKRPENQDSHISGTVGTDILLGVFDGIGGLDHGKEASTALKDSIQNAVADGYSLRSVLYAIKNTSESLYGQPYKNGTTIALGVFDTDTRVLTVISSGDSRLYISDSPDCPIDSLQQLSIDDTWSNLLPDSKLGRTDRGRSVLRYAIGTEKVPSVRVSKYDLSSADCVNILAVTDGFWHTLRRQIGMGIHSPLVLDDIAKLAISSGETDNITAVLGKQL